MTEDSYTHRGETSAGYAAQSGKIKFFRRDSGQPGVAEMGIPSHILRKPVRHLKGKGGGFRREFNLCKNESRKGGIEDVQLNCEPDVFSVRRDRHTGCVCSSDGPDIRAERRAQYGNQAARFGNEISVTFWEQMCKGCFIQRKIVLFVGENALPLVSEIVFVPILADTDHRVRGQISLHNPPRRKVRQIGRNRFQSEFALDFQISWAPSIELLRWTQFMRKRMTSLRVMIPMKQPRSSTTGMKFCVLAA